MELKKEIETVGKNVRIAEEKALRIASLTIKKKHYFAVVLPIMIFFIGLSKIDIMEKSGKSLPLAAVLSVAFVCIALSFLVYHRENKKINSWFILRPYLIVAIPLIAIVLLFGHTAVHAVFLAFLTVSFGFWIYHIH